MKKIFNLNIYGVSRRIIIGFATIIFAFAISVIFIGKIVNNSQITLDNLFEEHDNSVENLYEFRQIINQTKLSFLNIVYLPKGDLEIKTIQNIHNKQFPKLEKKLLKSLKLWESKYEKKVIISSLKLFNENIKSQKQIIELLPDFESHNNAMLKFQSEEILEIAILPVLDKINNDVQKSLEWHKDEKEKSRQLMTDYFKQLMYVLLIIGFIMTVLGVIATQITASKIAKPLQKMKELIFRLSEGELVSGQKFETKDEIEEISISSNKLIDSMKYNARFAESIGEGMFDLVYEPLSDKDELGYSLKQMNFQIKNLIESLQTTQKQTLLAKNKAEEALISKSQFLSVMSHEIRTPLNAILGMSNLLNDASLSEEQKDYLVTIQFSAKNLLHLINDILDITKLEAGKVIIENVDFNLYNQIQSIQKSHLVAASEKSILLDINSNITANTLYNGDSYRLNQVLNNLINNAIKFTHKGKITIKANVVNSSSSFDTILFEIEDTGIGIPLSKQDIIFESFTQADLNTTRLYGGSGLGLSICKKLIESMGSKIQLTSTVGVGSVFSFELNLPKTIILNSNENILPESNAINVEGKNILLVEDNTINAKVMAGFFKKWKINFELAENGKIATEKVEEGKYDLILMDLQMPIMDGYEATKIIKSKQISTPIIALSAEALHDIKTLLDEFGFNDYVSKPFVPQDLINRISYFTSSEYLANKLQTKDNQLVSFYRYNELANNDSAFLKMILCQVLEEFQIVLTYFEHDLSYINEKKVVLETMFNKIMPSLKMLSLSDLYLSLEKILKIEDADMENSNELKLHIEKSIRAVILELQTKIKNI